ncbi:glycosyltransferase [Nocardioides sp.]|uniref:glycosyltransferase n=1 Tax=Nocardioides sp. TaxID=35761 RepID=UPI0025FECC2A|nr:glycosyltransferase [Nocardioides sp.]
MTVFAELATPALVLGTEPEQLPEGVTYLAPGDEVPEQPWATVALVVADETELRLAVSHLPPLGRAKHVMCSLASALGPVTTVLRPEWPPLAGLHAETADGGARTLLTFKRPAPAAAVLVELARHTGTRVVTGNHGLVVDGLPVAVDPTPVTDEVPASVTTAPVEPSEVLGHPPVRVEPDADADAVGPLDEALLNPVGFRRDWDRGPVPLPSGAPTPAMVASLRDAHTVVVGPGADPRTVAGLAMAGVPLVGDRFDVADPAQLDDPMRREEHSVRLRRAALREHSQLAWRQRLAARSRLRAATYPSVSVLLPTRRPEQLAFALDQVARQRGVDELELVLATHGFEADPGLVRERLGARPVTLLPMPAETVFGDVLRAASDAAGGDVVLKMDDDDWYGPEVVADLLLARHYSGAELVGMPAEMVYLEPIRTTVRRRGASEVFGGVVAGGTMMIDRAVLREIGGFRSVPRHVDARLIEDLRDAGGGVYRTHGLGYVLRRTVQGHTWDPGLGYFLTRQAVSGQWRGFRPSTLLEADR